MTITQAGHDFAAGWEAATAGHARDPMKPAAWRDGFDAFRAQLPDADAAAKRIEAEQANIRG